MDCLRGLHHKPIITSPLVNSAETNKKVGWTTVRGVGNHANRREHVNHSGGRLGRSVIVGQHTARGGSPLSSVLLVQAMMAVGGRSNSARTRQRLGFSAVLFATRRSVVCPSFFSCVRFIVARSLLPLRGGESTRVGIFRCPPVEETIDYFLFFRPIAVILRVSFKISIPIIPPTSPFSFYTRSFGSRTSFGRRFLLSPRLFSSPVS
ncbi:hypothetical protein L596_014163 [Steinernema carpocapsae]|uniref:Uncharacterized protein n=1 Tax=Steinernema carpocapsae TaxID=34508 RepID=A0A4U5NAW8_STECR|nr:hypothetical protein L596_014163 [Steinernema carpocapsae]